MKVSKLIAELQRDYKPDDELIIGYWDKAFIQSMIASDDYELTDDDVSWLSECDYSWSSINDQISDYLETLIAEETEEKRKTEQEEQLWEA